MIQLHIWPKTQQKNITESKKINNKKKKPWPSNNRHSPIQDKLQRPSTLLITCIALIQRLLPLERLHHFPFEVRDISSKVPISCCLQEPPISTSLQIQINCNHPRPEIKAFHHYLQNLLIRNLPSAVSINKY
jgi:hypothetical protein